MASDKDIYRQILDGMSDEDLNTLTDMLPEDQTAFKKRAIAKKRDVPPSDGPADPLQSLKDLGIPEGFPEAIIGTLGSEEGRSRLDFKNSFMEALKGLGTVIKNVAFPSKESDLMISDFGKLGLGTVANVGFAAQRNDPRFPKRVRGELETMSGEMGEAIGRKFTDPDEFAADPLFGPAILSGLIPGGGTGTLGTLARIGRAMDPIVATAEGVGGAARLTRFGAKGVRHATEALTGLTSGVGAPTGGEAGLAGRVGERGDFLQAVKGKKTAFELGQDVATGLKGKRREAGKIKGDFIDATNAEGITVDITDLKQDILGEGGLLDELNISVKKDGDKLVIDAPTSFTVGDQVSLEEALKDIINADNRISVEELDEIKQAIQGISTSKNRPKRRRVISMIARKVRGKLSNIKIRDGTTYDQAILPISDYNKRIESIEKRIGRPEIEGGPQDVNEMLEGRALAAAFNPGVPRIDRTAALEEIDKLLPDVPVRSQAAGLNFSEIIPSGLVGKNEFMRLIFGGIAAKGVSEIEGLLQIPVAALALGFFIPQTAGRGLVLLGAAERKAAYFQGIAKAVIDRSKKFGINPKNMTIGQVLGRMDAMKTEGPEAPPKRPDIMSTLSNLQPHIQSILGVPNFPFQTKE